MKLKVHFEKKRAILFIIIFITVPITFFYFNSNIFYNNKINAKVMTWNISGANGTENEKNIEDIFDEINENDPDIIGLQEVLTDIDVKALADELDMNYYYAEAGETNEGNLLLTKYNIKHVEVIDLPLIDGTRPRVIIKAEIEIKNKIFYVLISHFSRYDKPIDHWNQAKFVSSLISETSHSRLILMGDLNFAPFSLPYIEITIKVRDSYRYLNNDQGYTFRSNDRFKRIDYIFCTFDIIPIKSEVICSEASDHCAVITTFR